MKIGWRGGQTRLRERELVRVRIMTGRGECVDQPSWQMSDQAEAVRQSPDGLSSYRWPLVTDMMHLESQNVTSPSFPNISASILQASKQASWKELSFHLLTLHSYISGNEKKLSARSSFHETTTP